MLPNEQMDLKELVAGSARGDRNCQQKLFMLYYRKMMGICLRYAGNREEARDLLHDGFIKVFDHIGKFNFRGSFEGWIRRIMVNTTIDHYRKNKNIFLTELNENHEQGDPEEPDIDSVEQLNTEDIMKAVQKLSPAYRTVFNLYVVDGFSHKEVAGKLGISVGTSKSNLAKAKVNLRKMFANVIADMKS